jgi:hypothetical protein
MKCYFQVLPAPPTKQERDGLSWLAEVTMQNRTFEHVRVSFGDLGQSRIEPIFGHSIQKMSEKTTRAEEPQEEYSEILAQCSFCGRFSFATAGEFPRCFPDGPSYCEEWLQFCQELDIDASTACNADPRYDYWWPRQSPMRDLAFEAAKAIQFDDPHWERRISELHPSMNTLRDQRIFTTNEERRAMVDMVKRYVSGANFDISFQQTWLAPGINGNVPLIDKFGLTRLKQYEDYVLAKRPVM